MNRHFSFLLWLLLFAKKNVNTENFVRQILWHNFYVKAVLAISAGIKPVNCFTVNKTIIGCLRTSLVMYYHNKTVKGEYETAMGKVITKASICISQKTRTLWSVNNVGQSEHKKIDKGILNLVLGFMYCFHKVFGIY